MRGKVWVFGNNIDTDAIEPTKYAGVPRDVLLKHVLEVNNPRFPLEIKPGDIIVAGSNFGCGSSREGAPTALKEMGVGAIVAESFARIFFRNSIAIGLPAIVCHDAAISFKDGEEIEIDLAGSQVANVTKGFSLKARPLPEPMLAVLSRGGILPLLKEIGQKNKLK